MELNIKGKYALKQTEKIMKALQKAEEEIDKANYNENDED